MQKCQNKVLFQRKFVNFRIFSFKKETNEVINKIVKRVRLVSEQYHEPQTTCD